jgi:hypothetical protein
MAKRFTDSDKWKKKWFRKLSPELKCLWVYICDNCDICGLWDVDFELASVFIGLSLNEEIVKEKFAKQYKVINGGSKWFIKDFVAFQYGELVDNNNLHRSVIKKLKELGVFEGLNSPSAGDKDKDKVKDKVIIEKVVKEKQPTDKVFDYFCLKYKATLNKDFVANFGKDKKLIKDLLNIIKENELIPLIDRFFASDDEFIQKAGYTIGVFKSQINKLNTKKTSLITFKKED